MIRIVTDSTAEYTVEEALEKNIEFACLQLLFDTQTFLDKKELSGEELYKMLEKTPSGAKTSLPSPEAFYQIFSQYENTDDEIICITISSKVSGTYQSACIARDMLPDMKITVIDSLTATIGLRLLIDLAISLRDENKSYEEIVNTIESIKDKVFIAAVVDTLEYFVKGGRLSKQAGFAGTVMKLKPIISFDNGDLKVIGKGIGSKKATSELLKLLPPMNHDYPNYIGYTGNPKLLDQFINVLEEELSFTHDAAIMIGACIGVHAGPGAKAIAYFHE